MFFVLIFNYRSSCTIIFIKTCIDQFVRIKKNNIEIVNITCLVIDKCSMQHSFGRVRLSILRESKKFAQMVIPPAT